MNELTKPSTNLEDFPPILRQVLEYKLNSGPERITFKEICDTIGVNYESFKHAKWKYKEKYNKDFDLYLYNHRLDPIKNSAYEIYASITDKAISGNIGQQRLVTELLGDIKDKVEIDHKITGLFAVVGSDPNIIPQDIIEADKINKPDGKQVIDIDYED